MFILIENGELYTPRRLGTGAVLLAHDRIALVGDIDPQTLRELPLPLHVIDASDCVVIPGLIDAHEQFLGGSGEQGFGSQIPELAFSEIVSGGITTAAGCLGLDTITKTMPGLFAKARAFGAEGLSAYLYTGGCGPSAATLTGSIRGDLLFVREVLGAGGVVISDARVPDCGAAALAQIVADAHLGGLLAGKAGITHVHVGAGKAGLEPLRELLATRDVEPGWLYPTHVARSSALMDAAISLTQAGMTVDIDTQEEDLAAWLGFYLKRRGDPNRLTVSSSAAISGPGTLFGQLRACALKPRLDLESLLPLVTANPARVLGLSHKGQLEPGFDADVVVLHRESLTIKDVVAGGCHVVRDGQLAVAERFRALGKRQAGPRSQHPEPARRPAPSAAPAPVE